MKRGWKIKNDKYKHLYQRSDSSGKIASRSARGSFWVLFGQGSSLIFTVLRTVILARLLSPDDFGVVAMVLVVLGFAQLFKDMGLSLSIVQRQQIDHYQVSNIFWFGVALTAGLALLICATSPLISRFYSDGRLIGITWVLSLSVVFGGLTMVPQALLRRNMRFRDLAFLRVGSIFISSAIGILLAFGGVGYWALVWQFVLQSLFLCGGAFLLCRWIPVFPKKGVGTVSMLKFGLNVTAMNVFVYIASAMDKMLIGRFVGAYDLGLYSKSYQLASLPFQQIRMPLSSVALSGLSSVQNRPNEFRMHYLKFVSLVTYLVAPVSIAGMVLTKEIVAVVLGEQWMAAVPIFRALLLGGCVASIVSSADQVPLAMGNSRRYRNIGLFLNTLRIVILCISFWIFGVVGLACSQAATYLLLGIPLLYYCFKGTSVRIRDFFLYVSPPLGAALLPVVLLFVFSKYGFVFEVPLIGLFVNGGIYLLVYVGACIVLDLMRSPGSLNILSFLRSRFKGRQ